MVSNSSIYDPGFSHSWTVNLSWILAHVNKGSVFKVISNIEQNIYRTSKNNSGEYSAFFREICACLIADYQLQYDGDITILSPSNKWESNKYVTNGLVGNGINPSRKIIERIN